MTALLPELLRTGRLVVRSISPLCLLLWFIFLLGMLILIPTAVITSLSLPHLTAGDRLLFQAGRIILPPALTGIRFLYLYRQTQAAYWTGSLRSLLLRLVHLHHHLLRHHLILLHLLKDFFPPWTRTLNSWMLSMLTTSYPQALHFVTLKHTTDVPPPLGGPLNAKHCLLKSERLIKSLRNIPLLHI